VIAQEVLAPPPLDFYGISPFLRTTGTNQPGALPPLVAPSSANEPPVQFGPVQLRPHFLYRFLYGDGIPARPGEQLKTAINEIYPGIFMGLGTHWNLDYTPTLRFYSNSQFRDTTDHAVILNGGSTFKDWTLGFSQAYISSSEPLIQTGTQTDQETYSTAINAIYRMNSAMSLELGANQIFLFFGESLASEQLTDSRTWSTMDWFNYQFGPEFGAAIGPGFGYDDPRMGSDMTFEQLQGRLAWRPGEKLSCTVSGGVENRQFLNSDVPDSLHPLFGVSAQYHLFEPTSFSLGASRTVSASYFQDQLTENLTVSAGLRQRLLKKLYLDLNGGYRKTSYSATAAGINVNRDDAGTFFNVRLSLQLLKRGTVALFYQESDNSSNEPGFAYSSTQGGFELGYRF
jgi:hypothetical protein